MDPAATAEPLIAKDVKADICMGRGSRGAVEQAGEGTERTAVSALFYTCLKDKRVCGHKETVRQLQRRLCRNVQTKHCCSELSK